MATANPMSLSPNPARNDSHPLPPATTYRRLSLKRNLLWTGIGTAIYYVAQYAFLSLIAKMIDAEAVGQFALAAAVTTPIFMFSQMQFRSLQVTDTKGEYSFPDYFWTRFYGTVFAMIMIAIVAFTGSYSRESRAVICLFGLAKFSESLSDLTYGTLQSNDRMDYVAISQIIKSLLSVVLFAGILFLTRQLMPAILILGGVWALVFFGFDLPFARKVSATKSLFVFPTAKIVRQLVVLSLPLALTSTMNAYLINLPRYALEPFGGKQIGYFSAVASLLGMVNLVTSTVIQATLSRLSRFYQEENYRAFLRLALQTAVLYIGISLAMTIAVWLGGKTLVTALYTAEYQRYTDILLLMCIGMTINGFGVVGSLILWAGRKFRLQMIHTFTLLVICLPLYHVLVARDGIIGAGQAEFVKYILSGVLMNVFAFPLLYDLWRKNRPSKAEADPPHKTSEKDTDSPS